MLVWWQRPLVDYIVSLLPLDTIHDISEKEGYIGIMAVAHVRPPDVCN